MVQKLIVGRLHTNCYIYIDDITKEGIVIDPGGDLDKILDFINKSNIDIRYIILTHGHFDHILETLGLQFATNAKILMSAVDKDLINDKSKNMAFSMIDIKPFTPDKLLKHGDTIELGTTFFKVIATPGHTPGGISLYTDGILFSGDTLFYQNVGRTDLYGGNEVALWESINEKLFKLPDDTIVYPGHARQTTIRNEKSYWKA